jgi:hypothetical protein
VIDQGYDTETSSRDRDNSNPAQRQTNEESSKKRNPLVTKLSLDQPIGHKANSRPDEFDGAFGRHLRPRYLCLVPGDDDEEAVEHGTYRIVDVDEWDERFKGSDRLQYVFVSYTRKQFQTYTANEILEWGLPIEQQARQQEEAHRKLLGAMQPNDLQQLYEIGIKAAEDAEVKAFWIDVLCMEPESMDAHRICDVARGAKSMVIALKDTVDGRINSKASPSMDILLENWATRLWTLPEMLLAPTKHDLVVWGYTKNGPRKLDTIAKRNMAERAYTLDEDDPHLVRQLVDHFESNLHLSQTELLTIGLQCLVKRDTKPFTPGDPVYALMTLARRRPEPNDDDSLFVAFAKLSLMNDSDKLLERLICMLPPARGKPWFKIQDYWKAKLSDIDPMCQVAGIAADQSVILDGAEGASIVWHEIPRVAFMKRRTPWRLVAEMMIRGSPVWLIISITTLAAYAKPTQTAVFTNGKVSFHSSVNPLVAVGIVFFLLAISLISTLPWALLSMYRGKFWSTQAWFIGIEGPVNDLHELERKMFGFGEGRLKWSAYNSTLSRHRLRIDPKRLPEGECEGILPLTADLPLENGVFVRRYDQAGNLLPQLGMSKNSQSSEGSWSEGTQDTRADRTELKTEVEPDRIFTLVDTYTMTVTTFRAVHPPSVVLVCGREGGARRALLCSYNYRTQTFHRETVLRMQTEVLDRMARIPRFRFSMESQPLIPSVVAR